MSRWAATGAATLRRRSSLFSSEAATYLAETAERLVIALFLHDSRQLLLHVVLEEFDERSEVELLIDDGDAAI